MDDRDVEETISDRRVKLYRMREGAAHTIGSILTATGAVEALSENTSMRGVASVIVGLALEREAKDPSWFTSMLVLPVVAPAVWKVYKGSRVELTSAIEAFVLALKCACFYMTLRLLFMSRRLRQLGDLQRPKEL